MLLSLVKVESPGRVNRQVQSIKFSLLDHRDHALGEDLVKQLLLAAEVPVQHRLVGQCLVSKRQALVGGRLGETRPRLSVKVLDRRLRCCPYFAVSDDPFA
ncbi:hypothetical protein PJL15_03561 [Paenarthrobacter nitroguajacolicus]|nr:hypothetical protein [Paenarthrobacter nitroguajacolicus]